jgi:hypothetical protein
MTSTGIETVAFQLAAQCFNQLHYPAVKKEINGCENMYK